MRAGALVLLTVVSAVAALALPVDGWSAQEPTTAEAGAATLPGDRPVSDTVWYQGFLADSGTGEAIDGTVEIAAELFDQATGGASLWGPETHGSVPVAAGWFHIELGSIDSPLPDFASPPYYLQLTVGGELFDTRQRLASVPSAIRAGEVDGGGGGGIGGGGDAGYVPVFISANAIGNSNIYETSGRYSIGTTTSDAKLRVENSGGLPVLKLVNTAASTDFVLMEVERTGTSADKPILRMKSPWMAGNQHQVELVLVSARGETTVFWIDGWGGVNSTEGVHCFTSSGSAVIGDTDHEGADSAGVIGEHSAHDFDGIGVLGIAGRHSGGFGTGGRFEGGSVGVNARAFSDLTGGSISGVSASATGQIGATVYGAYGDAFGGDTAYGIYGVAGGATTTWAGYFSGNVHATGTMTADRAGFRIDHPGDPANAYLNHAFVASSEMKTVYDGAVLLDSSGSATVELPDWFETLNTSIRYQLTPIGAAAPDLHVAQKASGGHFTIAGGQPGLEVCWQVTGVRHDPSATGNAITVEEAKAAELRGKYLHPELYGAPEEAQINKPQYREAERR